MAGPDRAAAPDAGPRDASPRGGQPDVANGVRELLGPLVLEGSPPERELLARARELRRIIAPEGEAPEPAAGTGKSFDRLLLDDLTGEDAPLAAVANQISAPAVAATARALAATAASDLGAITLTSTKV